MTVIDSHPSAAQAINDYLVFDASSEDTEFRDKLLEGLAQMAPPMRYHDFVETVYANRPRSSAKAMELAASLARYAAGEGFTGFGTDRRGSRIADVLEAEAVGDPVPTDQPAAQEHLMLPEPEPEAPA